MGQLHTALRGCQGGSQSHLIEREAVRWHGAGCLRYGTPFGLEFGRQLSERLRPARVGEFDHMAIAYSYAGECLANVPGADDSDVHEAFSNIVHYAEAMTNCQAARSTERNP